MLEAFFVVAVPPAAIDIELLLAAGDALGAGIALAAGALAGVEELSAVDVDFLVFLPVEAESVDAEVEAMPPELPAGWAMVSLAVVFVFFDFLPDVAPVSEDEAALVVAPDVSVAAPAAFLLFLDDLPDVDVVSEVAVVDAADVSVESAAPFLPFLDFFVVVVLVLAELALEDASGVAV